MTYSSGVGPSVPGMFTLVLHTHLPWLAHHGRWPVGEEWLYQSWAGAYLPVAQLLADCAEKGNRSLVTLSLTPVVAAQLDDPYCLHNMEHWLANWELRALEAQALPDRYDAGVREYIRVQKAWTQFDTSWRHGGSSLFRRLVDSGVIELLGGPLAHPFQPLLAAPLRRFALHEGLADTHRRLGYHPRGIWAPECAYAPGLEKDYSAAQVSHFLVDGPSLHGDTALGHPVEDSSVVAFGRDLPTSYRVWSPKSGYPGHKYYRDFHTYDHVTGLKLARVTGRQIPPEQKAPYDPIRAEKIIHTHVNDFINRLRSRLINESERIGRPAHIVAAFDTELFGHWWYEGPLWLAQLFDQLPQAGIRIGTLSDALNQGFVGHPVSIPPSSWGSGKDWHVWSGHQVTDLVTLNSEVVDTALQTLANHQLPGQQRDRVADQILRETLLTVSSDWPFMVSKNSAANYARSRAHLHAHATREICEPLRHGNRPRAEQLADQWNQADNLFGALDARRLIQ